MKKLLITITILVFGFSINAQIINNVNDLSNEMGPNNIESGILPLVGGDSNSTEKPEIIIEPNWQRDGETFGRLSVSLSGASSYIIPIEVPPGINGVQPGISIAYNSQGGNGIAGYGWNINGISKISRIPSSEFHDGIKENVNFKDTDQYELDGQRLILKSGTHGTHGAQYGTENFSNIKIEARSIFSQNFSGPGHFIVSYPDGSKAYYGQTPDSRGYLNYSISYWVNPQGLRVSYEYSKSLNSQSIKNIKYGNSGSNQSLNEIRFIYDSSRRRRDEEISLGTVKIIRGNILKSIEIFGDGSKFRSYNLLYNITSLFYNRLTEITEVSANGNEQKNSIKFEYENTDSTVGYEASTTDLGLQNIEQRNANAFPIDFRGDGNMDLIVSTKNRSDLWIFKDLNSGYQNTPVSIPLEFESLFSNSYINNSGLKMPGQGLTVVANGPGREVDFQTYTGASSTRSLIFQYKKTWNAPTHRYHETASDYTDLRIPMEYLPGDFDGDGLTDVIAVGKPYFSKYCWEIECGDGGVNNPLEELQNTKLDSINSNQVDSKKITKKTSIRQEDEENSNFLPPDFPDDCYNCNTGTTDYRGTYFINLKNDDSANFTKFSGNLNESISNGDILNTGDFNGDGKTDILHITNGKLFVYSFDENNSIYLDWSLTSSSLNVNNRTLIGDFNGDGKTDFLHSAGENTYIFNSFISTGTYFNIKSKSQPFQYKVTLYNGDGTLYGYNLIPLDTNGDGKTDIIEYNTTTYNSNTNGSQEIKVFNNIGSRDQTQLGDFGNVNFNNGGTATKYGNLKHYPIPIFLNSNDPNKSLSFASISNKWITKFKFNKDHREDVLLRKIKNNGVEYEISYNNLDANELTNDLVQFYQSSYDQTYPYVNLHSAGGTKVVTKLEKKSIANSNIPSTFKFFGYQNAVTHYTGLGFQGFEGIAVSNWHKDASDRIYTVSKFDHSLRSAKVLEWSDYYSYTFTLNSSNFITKKENQFSSTTSTRKVFNLKLNSSISTNNVDGTSMITNYEYDQYNNTEKVEQISSSGSQTELIEYENNLGANYYVGRVKKISINSLIGGNSFDSEQEFIYQDDLLQEKKVRGNNTFFNKENYEYDNYGNLVKKIITPYETPSRQVEFQYDSSDRFINKVTDVEGLETSYNFNVKDGTLISEANPFGQETSYEYDSWLNTIKVTDYLGNNTDIIYDQNDYYRSVTTTSDEGDMVTMLYDPFKRLVDTSEKNVVGDVINIKYQYNSLDQLIAFSEPYEGNEPSQWNQIEYDIYGRTQKSTLHTGKTYNVLYNGLTVTVDDGTKEVAQTLDDIGNTVSVTDPGGTINYDYYGNSNLKSATYNGSTVSITQDGWGRKIQVDDPSAGSFSYSYNGFGEIIEENTPNGDTNWTYSNIGKLERKEVVGNKTDMTLDYTYDPTHKFLKMLSVSDNYELTTSVFEYTYDSQTRLKELTETNSHAKFSKKYTYDSFGRIDTEDYYAELFYNGKSSSKKIINSYQNSVLNSINDSGSNTLIWRLNDVNARGQITSASMGQSLEERRDYDEFGFIEEKRIVRGSSPFLIMKLNTDFNVETGVLNSRQNSMFSWSETFEYDDLDRLVEFNDNVTSGVNTYDDAGRIELNSAVGNYNYTGNSYKVGSIDLNNQGDLYYQRNSLQKIVYNAFQKPVTIDDKDNEKIDFHYNAFQKRSHMFYGNYEDQVRMRSKRKHYSFDGSMEVKYDFETEETEFTFYVGGDGYNSPAIWRSKQDQNRTTEDFYYLHRDHLGSIMLITSGNGQVKEKRHFDAWGNIVKLTGENNNEIRQFSFLDRGYTGHEHLMGVNLIHMNARLYDPNLKRFLSPDNYIQDLANTQNFDRYGYVLNNPLKYVDPTGNNWQNGEGGLNDGQQTWLGALFLSAVGSLEGKPIGRWIGNYFEAYGNALTSIPGFFNDTYDSIGRFFDKNVIKPIERLFKNKPKPYNIRNPTNLNSDPMAGSSMTTSTSFFGGNGNTSGNLGILQGYNITTSDVVDTALDFVPIAGGIKDIYRGFENGDGWLVALGAGIIVLDVFTLGTASIAKGSIKTGIKLGSKAVTKYAAKGADDVVNVFRVYGGKAKPGGFSWTSVNPNSVGNFRNAAGLPNVNTGRFVIEGTVKRSRIINSRSALPLDGNKGGLLEYIIDPKNVNIHRVSGANPGF